MKINLRKTFGETHLLAFETMVDGKPKQVLVAYARLPSSEEELELPFEKMEEGKGSLLMTLDYYIDGLSTLSGSLTTPYVRFPNPEDHPDDNYDYRQELQTLMMQMEVGTTPYQLFSIELPDTAVGVYLVDFGTDMTAEMDKLGFAVSTGAEVFEKIHHVIFGF